MNVLDISGFKEKDQELKKVILEQVKDRQKTIIQPHYDVLLMTTKQYDMLQGDPELRQMYQSKDHMYYTPYNVMEVQIKGITEKTILTL